MGWIRKKDMGEEKQKQNSSSSKERSGSKRNASAASGGPGDPKKPSRFGSLPGISGAQLQNLNPFKSVGVKLFLIFFVAIAAIVLTLGLTSYSKAKSTIKNNTALANSQTIQQTQEKLDIILKQYEDMAMQMFFDPEMQSVIDELARNRQDEYQNFVLTDQINKKLSNQLNSNSSIKAIYLVPPEESQRIISSGSGGLDINTIREADWLKNAKKQIRHHGFLLQRVRMEAFPSSWSAPCRACPAAEPTSLSWSLRLTSSKTSSTESAWVTAASFRLATLTVKSLPLP
ncbi:cache domain-containing protein [Paenibacillus sp. AR247]|uniref:cache domain-containing protein n=1 Tax=Paenibacillus sp. AR247 TaxID=1631599 RepID=UPI002156F89E|nr:cache domain-containing protein [Paenibacillus sp. AR247]